MFWKILAVVEMVISIAVLLLVIGIISFLTK